MMRAITLALPLLIAAIPPASAQRHDSSAPIDVASDHAELDDRAHRATLSGNVRIRQADMTLTAARATALLNGQVTNDVNALKTGEASPRGLAFNLSIVRGRMVGVAGFEPTTLCPPDKCATRLRYTPTSGRYLVAWGEGGNPHATPSSASPPVGA